LKKDLETLERRKKIYHRPAEKGEEISEEKTSISSTERKNGKGAKIPVEGGGVLSGKSNTSRRKHGYGGQFQ